MAPETTAATLVVHALRIKGFADSAGIARFAGLSMATVEAECRVARDAGLVTSRKGRMDGWSLTLEGRAALAKSLSEELDEHGIRPAIEEIYRQFGELNPTLLQLCSDWQVRVVDGEQTINDHSDKHYDADVVARLIEVHEQAMPMLAELGSKLQRFQRYGPALDHAVERVMSGEGDWFTKPLIDSFHTVWFELHEDLLATLGLERTEDQG